MMEIFDYTIPRDEKDIPRYILSLLNKQYSSKTWMKTNKLEESRITFIFSSFVLKVKQPKNISSIRRVKF